jgi:HD-GYP domain-containing protein (c-di-GMP phosphodiesterase class II)
VVILREGRGRQWDPQIVDAFVRAIADQLPAQDAPRLHLVQPELAVPAAS